MGHYDDELPPEFQDLAELMRSERVRATALELDQLKLQIVRRASHQGRGRKGLLMRSRTATLLAISMLTLGAGGTFAVAWDSGGGDGSGAKTEYKEGKGCGDRNHQHSRRDECKKEGGEGGDRGGAGNGGHGHHGGR